MGNYILAPLLPFWAANQSYADIPSKVYLEQSMLYLGLMVSHWDILLLFLSYVLKILLISSYYRTYLKNCS